MENITIARAKNSHSGEIAVLVGKLLEEIMERIGINVFHFNLEETKERLSDFIINEKNYIFIAVDTNSNKIIGFATTYQGYALYAEGAIGTMAELYICPEFRSHGIGKKLVCTIKEFGNQKGWKRIEVTTPPLPQFDSTLAFY